MYESVEREENGGVGNERRLMGRQTQFEPGRKPNGAKTTG